jgi:hypothetical protein
MILSFAQTRWYSWNFMRLHDIFMDFSIISGEEFTDILGTVTLTSREVQEMDRLPAYFGSWVSICFSLFVHTNFFSLFSMVVVSFGVSNASERSRHVAGQSLTRCSGVSSASLHSRHLGSSFICNRLRCLLSTQCPVIVWINLFIVVLFKLRIPLVVSVPALLINIFVCLQVFSF